MSCQTNEHKIKFEQDVMSEIFPDLMDSIWVEVMVTTLPPPIRKIYSKSKKTFTYEVLEKNEADREDEIERLKSLRKDSTASKQIVIVVNDSVYDLRNDVNKKFLEECKLSPLVEDNRTNDGAYKLDLTKLKPHNTFRLIYSSEFKISKFLPLETLLLNHISFSRIKFDKEKTAGVLTCRYSGNGTGYTIFIRKVNSHWTINETRYSWIE